MPEGEGANSGGTAGAQGGEGGTGAAGSGGAGAAGAAGQGGEGGTQTGQGAGDAGAGTGQGTATGTGGDQQQTFPAEYVKALRDESAKYRAELRDLQKKVKGFEDASLSDAEKVAKRVAELEADNARLSAAQRSADVTVAAQKAGAIHPEVVARLVPSDAEDVAAEMTRIKKAYPTLFGTPRPQGSADGGTREGPPPKKDMNAFIRASAGRG